MVQVVKVFLIFLSALFLLSGCGIHEPYSTTQRFDKISKDAVLEATKKLFLSKDSDILIDSYRNKVKAIEINSAIYGINGLSLHEYTIEVIEDNSGSIAQLFITSEDGIDQEKSYVNSDFIHNFVWDDLQDILESQEYKYIDQREQLIELNDERVHKKLQEVNIKIGKADPSSILNFDEDIIELEDVDPVEVTNTNEEETLEQKDDFEQRLDDIVNSVDEVIVQ